MERDFRECDQQLIADGVIPNPSRPLSEAYLRSVYEDDLLVHSCLVENGFPTPPTVSWETYLDMYRKNAEFWDPMAEVRKAAQTRGVGLLEDAYEKCVESD